MRLLATFAAVLAFALPNLARATDASPLTGHYAGSYVCAQGKTGLTLDLVGAPDGKITGVFAFAPTQGSGPLAASGSYRLTGRVSESGLLSLDPDGWISQPEGYAPVGLVGFLGFGDLRDVDGFSGQVKAEVCQGFKVDRAKP